LFSRPERGEKTDALDKKPVFDASIRPETGRGRREKREKRRDK